MRVTREARWRRGAGAQFCREQQHPVVIAGPAAAVFESSPDNCCQDVLYAKLLHGSGPSVSAR